MKSVKSPKQGATVLIFNFIKGNAPKAPPPPPSTQVAKLASFSWTNHSPLHIYWNVLESSLIAKIPDETQTGMLYTLPISNHYSTNCQDDNIVCVLVL